MSDRGGVGRADLARAFASRAEDQRAIAEALGYHLREEQPAGFEHATDQSAMLAEPAGSAGNAVSDTDRVEIPFLAPGRIRFFERRPSPPIFGGSGDADWAQRPSADPPMPPLGDVDGLSAKLRELLARSILNADIDVDAAVTRISRGLYLGEPPQRSIRRWAPRIRIILDRRPHLLPIWADQVHVVQIVRQVAVNAQIDILLFDEQNGLFREAASRNPGRIESSQEVWLALTDFGAFSGVVEDCAPWRALADALGPGKAAALSPAPRSLVPTSILSRWRVEHWEDWKGEQGPIAAQVERLLVLLSPCTLLAAGMVRALRVELGDAGGVEVEQALLRHPDIALQGAVVSEFHPERRRALLSAFETQPEDDRRIALGVIRAWRLGRQDLASFGVRGEDRWFAELLDLSEDSRALSPRPEDVDDARAWFAVRARRAAGEGRPLTLAEQAHLSRIGTQTNAAWREDAFAQAVWAIKGPEGFTPPAAANSAALALTTISIGRLAIGQSGPSLIASLEAAGSPLALLPSDDGLLAFAPLGMQYLPPPFTTFRDRLSNGTEGPEMIALPLGTFVMGSPKEEEGRFEDEGPPHEVRITEPFALAKHPLTFEEYDAFCVATGRRKPDDSGWGRGRRPVIGVSWDDANAYCDWLRAETGEDYRLPSESEWEYACRAGSTSRYWWGDEWDAGRANGAYQIGKTTEIRSYAANAWGLYDTLGNVFEWCADCWQIDYVHPRSQAALQSDSGETSRVIRGGSWYDSARYSRAAYRGRVAPDDGGGGYLGFRLARGQGSGAPAGKLRNAERSSLRSGEGRGQRSEPAGPQRGGGPPPHRGGESDFSFPGVARCRVVPGKSASIGLAELPPSPFVIRTDRAELTIQRITRSDLGDWASGMGRDRFGLWADFTLGDIRQRLRFCPPGRFLMGSQEDEAGRYSDEGPQTEVTFERGFWLFDTPVTQELYQAVTGSNPSHFVSPRRPVEQVDFVEVGEFIAALNALKKGLDLGLPSEAQWEYACRAGTTAATYSGPIEILGENNAPILNGIAWYAGNSGVDFELEDGQDSSGWIEKQFEHRKAGTRAVKLKRANPWGLYDMLGNVFEWCEDAWHDSHEGAAPDGLPRGAFKQGGGTIRVIRGGSWGADARLCRATSRDWSASVNWYDDLGFRPARGQEGALASKPGNAERYGLRFVRSALRRRNPAGPPRRRPGASEISPKRKNRRKKP